MREGGEGRADRRGRLETVAGPAPWHDCLSTWNGGLTDGTALTVEYVPDRLVLAPRALAAYLPVLEAGGWPTLEALVTTVLDDINNQLVPRWVRVSGRREAGGVRHAVTVADRQPGWDNPGLLVHQ
jgi:NADPH-dependent 7-cyano-7-deazaguanine reductase QueF